MKVDVWAEVIKVFTDKESETNTLLYKHARNGGETQI